MVFHCILRLVFQIVFNNASFNEGFEFLEDNLSSFFQLCELVFRSKYWNDGSQLKENDVIGIGVAEYCKILARKA